MSLWQTLTANYLPQTLALILSLFLQHWPLVDYDCSETSTLTLPLKMGDDFQEKHEFSSWWRAGKRRFASRSLLEESTSNQISGKGEEKTGKVEMEQRGEKYEKEVEMGRGKLRRGEERRKE